MFKEQHRCHYHYQQLLKMVKKKKNLKKRVNEER